jgi:hypothetical protein
MFLPLAPTLEELKRIAALAYPKTNPTLLSFEF